MFPMKIYPAIDILGGRCVRLHRGEKDQVTVYYEDPAEPADLWCQAGAEWVHVVDLDGAFEGVPANRDAIRRIASTGLQVELGGGIRTRDAVQEAIEIGVSRVVIGTRACESDGFVRDLVRDFGEQIAVGIDARNGKVAVNGWVNTTEIGALDLARRMVDLGVGTLIYTDIATDGTLTGPNFAAQEELLATVPANVIASGGVSRREDIQHFADIARRFANLDGVIVGKALYDEKVSLKDLLDLAKRA